MHFQVDYDSKLPQIQLKFDVEAFQSLKHYKTTLMSVRAYAAMVELDPELEIEDLEEIVEKTQELGKDCFTFIIGPDEIEVDI